MRYNNLLLVRILLFIMAILFAMMVMSISNEVIKDAITTEHSNGIPDKSIKHKVTWTTTNYHTAANGLNGGAIGLAIISASCIIGFSITCLRKKEQEEE